MHSEIEQDKPGRCPKCGMDLVAKGSIFSMQQNDTNIGENKSFLVNYKPLFIIIGMILLVTLVIGLKDWTSGIFSLKKMMAIFMSGFFLVFSGFKLLDLKGFAQGYFTYDILAKRIFSYGYIYPFIELLLGALYITSFNLLATNVFAFVIMGISGIGVATKLIKHEKFQCACLGTVFKLPLAKVTLIEDFGMAIMALIMIFIK